MKSFGLVLVIANQSYGLQQDTAPRRTTSERVLDGLEKAAVGAGIVSVGAAGASHYLMDHMGSDSGGGPDTGGGGGGKCKKINDAQMGLATPCVSSDISTVCADTNSHTECFLDDKCAFTYEKNQKCVNTLGDCAPGNFRKVTTLTCDFCSVNVVDVPTLVNNILKPLCTTGTFTGIPTDPKSNQVDNVTSTAKTWRGGQSDFTLIIQNVNLQNNFNKFQCLFDSFSACSQFTMVNLTLINNGFGPALPTSMKFYAPSLISLRLADQPGLSDIGALTSFNLPNLVAAVFDGDVDVSTYCTGNCLGSNCLTEAEKEELNPRGLCCDERSGPNRNDEIFGFCPVKTFLDGGLGECGPCT